MCLYFLCFCYMFIVFLIFMFNMFDYYSNNIDNKSCKVYFNGKNYNDVSNKFYFSILILDWEANFILKSALNSTFYVYFKHNEIRGINTIYIKKNIIFFSSLRSYECDYLNKTKNSYSRVLDLNDYYFSGLYNTNFFYNRKILNVEIKKTTLIGKFFFFKKVKNFFLNLKLGVILIDRIPFFEKKFVLLSVDYLNNSLISIYVYFFTTQYSNEFLKVKYDFIKISFIRIFFLKKNYKTNVTLLCFFKYLERFFFSVILFILVYNVVLINYQFKFLKQVFIWLLLFLFLYFLISIFTFFLKKYRYSKFTTPIKRFWKRAYICFWLIEFTWFMVFITLIFNSTHEAFIFQDKYFPWLAPTIRIRPFIKKTVIWSFFFLLIIYFIFFLKFSKFLYQIFFIFIILIFIYYFLFCEVIHFFDWLFINEEEFMEFDWDDDLWFCDDEEIRHRIHYYFMLIILILKFWHFMFIFLSTLFFLSKSIEKRKISYTFYSLLIQNFIFFYIMNFIVFWGYIKFLIRVVRRDDIYFWFIKRINTTLFHVFFFYIKWFVMYIFSFDFLLDICYN